MRQRRGTRITRKRADYADLIKPVEGVSCTEPDVCDPQGFEGKRIFKASWGSPALFPIRVIRGAFLGTRILAETRENALIVYLAEKTSLHPSPSA